MASTIFVCGATGTQGGAIARHLRKSGLQVHALARNPNAPKAQALAAIGIKVFAGGYDDTAVLERAIAGCDGAFANFMPSLVDLTEEGRHATAVIQAAKAARVKHMIYSTAIGLHKVSSRPGWDPESLPAKISLSKIKIREAIIAAGFDTWTVLRPGKFMTDIFVPSVNFQFPTLVERGEIVTSLDPTFVQSLTDPDDIGAFGAAAFLRPDDFGGKDVDFFSELKTYAEIAAALSAASGKKITVKFLTADEAEAQKDNILISIDRMVGGLLPFYKDLDVSVWGIPTGNFEDFLVREKARVVETYGHLP